MSNTLKKLRCCLLFAGMMFCCGCNGSTDQSVGLGSVGNTFRVTKIHFQRSFTRIQKGKPDAKELPGIVAYVQLKDQFDDPIKALGMFRFEIYRYRSAVSDPRGERFSIDGKQEFDLTNVNINQKRWDSITRSYHLDLKLPPEVAKLKKNQKIVLQVTFSMNSEYRIRDILTLNLKSD
jgi:hypothetical protein